MCQRQLRRWLLFLVCSAALIAVEAKAEKIVLWQRIKTFPAAYELLDEALKVTEAKYGPVEIVASPKMEQGRAEQELSEGGQLHLAVLPPTDQRERSSISIPIPLTRGLLGLRVCLIRSEDREFFANLRSLEDFKAKGASILVGTHWPDKAFLQANDIPIIESEVYEDLFGILQNSKRACFSRSLTEILVERKMAGIFQLEVEESLLFRYDLPNFFFVSKNKAAFARRLEEGLRQLVANKTYHRIFWKHHARVFRDLDVFQRTLITLPRGPQRSDDFLKDPELWLPLRIDQKSKNFW